MSSREFIDGMCERICNFVDSDRYAVIDRGDEFTARREPLPERGAPVELRSLGPSVPPPPEKPRI